MERSKVISLFLFSLITINEAVRILMAIPMVAKSHSILGHAMAKHLVEAGHEVVFMTPFPQNNSIPYLREVSLEAINEEFRKSMKKTSEDFKLKNLVNTGKGAESIIVFYMSRMIHEIFFNIDEVSKILSDPKEKFDVVIAEWFFYDAIAGLSALYECPLIWFSTTEPTWNVLKLVDEVPNPAYTASLFSVYRPPLSFWQRATELWDLVKTLIILSFSNTSSEKSFYDTFLKDLAAKRDVNFPSYEDAIYNASMVLIASHPSYGPPYRLPQNAKYIGGFHIDKSPKPLPKDLKSIMDSAKDGIIYFSMGSNLKSSDMSNEMRDFILEMFGKLKQTVLWKFESDIQKISNECTLIEMGPTGEHSWYKERANAISMAYHDRPVPPAKELVHWVEHVVKTRGAPHLRSPALMVSWYQMMYLDLLIFVITVVVLLLLIIKKVVRKYYEVRHQNFKKNQ